MPNSEKYFLVMLAFLIVTVFLQFFLISVLSRFSFIFPSILPNISIFLMSTSNTLMEDGFFCTCSGLWWTYFDFLLMLCPRLWHNCTLQYQKMKCTFGFLFPNSQNFISSAIYNKLILYDKYSLLWRDPGWFVSVKVKIYTEYSKIMSRALSS